MEFCDTSLEAIAKTKKSFSEGELTKILKDICSGLQSLHKNNVVHLDIKPGIEFYYVFFFLIKINFSNFRRFAFFFILNFLEKDFLFCVFFVLF